MNRFLDGIRCGAVGMYGVVGMALCCCVGVADSADVQPSTFDTVIGHALLCLDELEPVYFFQYLSANFGAPYQHQGGAWWFRTPNTKLWGVPVSQVMVSDGHGRLLFVAATVDVAPDELAQAITNNAGIRYQPDVGAFPKRESATGSVIVYAQENAKRSKLYCALSPYLFRMSQFR